MTKKNLLNLLALFIYLLAFAGCASREGVQGADNASNAAQTEAAETAGTVDIQNPSGQTEEQKTFTEIELLELQDSLSEIVASGDEARCRELSVKQYFVTCEVNILSGRAESASDIQVCAEASDENIKARCEAQVKSIK